MSRLALDGLLAGRSTDAAGIAAWSERARHALHDAASALAKERRVDQLEYRSL